MNKDILPKKVIVSLTSFPEAIPYAIKDIRSILEGSLLPDKVVLYLDTHKFPGKVLPQELEDFQSKSPIFEVKFDDSEIRSYKKLIPALKDFPNDILVTIDDDILYSPNMLHNLIRIHKLFPDSIIAHRVRRARLDRPYRYWRKYKWYDFIFKKYHFSHLAMQTGVGGVLYPPHTLDEKMLQPELFMKIAPTTDDIWFWLAAVSHGTYVVPVPGWHPKTIEVGKPKEFSLKTINLKPNNDRNIKALKDTLEQYPEIKQKLENSQ